jgi:hypothetical protein
VVAGQAGSVAAQARDDVRLDCQGRNAVAGLPGELQDVEQAGEVSPDTGAGPGARPELRASDEDRDRAVEILRVAAGDGRLTAAELDQRIEAALTARTSGELAALTADLPAVPGQAGSVAAQAKDVVRLDYQGGNATRRGQWVVPARMEIRAVGGTVKLDFTNAVIYPAHTPDPGICAWRRTRPNDQARHRSGRRRDNRAWRNGQNPAAEWLERAGTPHSGGLGGEPRRPRHRPPTAADVPAMASAQAKTTRQVIPRLTSSAPRPCYPDQSPGPAPLDPVDPVGGRRGRSD